MPFGIVATDFRRAVIPTPGSTREDFERLREMVELLLSQQESIVTHLLAEGSGETITGDTDLESGSGGIYRIDCSGGAVTVTLPPLSTSYVDGVGDIYRFVKIDTTGNEMIIQTDSGAETIQGDRDARVSNQWDAFPMKASSSTTWDIY